MTSSSRGVVSRGRRGRPTSARPRRRPVAGQPVGDPALGVLADRLDEPVALEPGQGRVDLPDVERPGPPGPGLELGPQPRAVHRLGREQGQQSLTAPTP